MLSVAISMLSNDCDDGASEYAVATAPGNAALAPLIRVPYGLNRVVRRVAENALRLRGATV